jgi:hypothetical protein
MRSLICLFSALFWTLIPASGQIAQAAGPSKTSYISTLSTYFSQTSGGALVTVTGVGLKGATRVLFGDTPATYRVVSSSTIVATVPPRPVGLVDVRVQTPGGLTGPHANAQFRYHDAQPTAATVGVTKGSSSFTLCSTTTCGPVAATTANFRDPVTCRVTNSSRGAFGYFWTQAANSYYVSGMMFDGSWVEVTCDGVAGRNTTWPI